MVGGMLEVPELGLTVDDCDREVGYRQIGVWAEEIREWREQGDSYGDYITQRLLEDLVNAVIFLARQQQAQLSEN